MTYNYTPRIALIHALAESVEPIHAAFASCWPEAITFDLLDTSLSRDLAAGTSLQPAIIDRFVMLGRYAASTAGDGGTTAAILFTCSAFGPAIAAVKRTVNLPVLSPTEAAFDEALAFGPRLGLLVTFAPSLPALEAELRDLARVRGVTIQLEARIVEGALTALKSGDAGEHDRLVAEEAARMPQTDSLTLGQFSLARAAKAIAPVRGRPVLTTPSSAVERLQALMRRFAD